MAMAHKDAPDFNEDFDISGFDFGNLDAPEFDLDTLDILGDDDREETRYSKPRAHNPHRMSFVLYNNAEKLAANLKLGKGERADAIIGGDFIFGDFIEAYITTHDIGCRKLTISTLSLNQNNVDSLRNLIDGGYVSELNLIVSVYFWSNERRVLIPYIYEKLDVADKFQLAVATSIQRPRSLSLRMARKSSSTALPICEVRGISNNSPSRKTRMCTISTMGFLTSSSRNTKQ